MAGMGRKPGQWEPGDAYKWGQSMQIKIRQPVSVDVTPSGDNSSFTIRFVSRDQHEAAVVVPRELLADLTLQLQAIGDDAVDDVPDDEKRNLLLRALSGIDRAA